MSDHKYWQGAVGWGLVWVAFWYLALGSTALWVAAAFWGGGAVWIWRKFPSPKEPR